MPDISILSKASLFSLAYGFVKKSDRVNKLAERAYLAVFGGWDKVVKNAARLIPFERQADGTVKFFKTKVTLSFKIYDGVYPLARGSNVDAKAMDTSQMREWVSGDELTALEREEATPEVPGDTSHEVETVLAHNRFGDKPERLSSRGRPVCSNY